MAQLLDHVRHDASRGSIEAAAFSMRDLFIIHASAKYDRDFATHVLLPALGDVDAMLSSRLTLGMPIVQALEEGVTSSRATVVVLSPAFLDGVWSEYGESLAAYHAARGGLLIPLLLADCAVPLRLDFRVKIDCRAEADRPTELARLRAELALPPPAVKVIPCPYPGMRPYTAENAALFCGREREVDKLVSRIAGGARAVYAIGPSGSGKSSLLLSGVAPRLGRTDGVVRHPFVVHVMRPGATPSARLRAVLGEHALRGHGPAATRPDADAPPHALIVDQLEEVFTLAATDARRTFWTDLTALERQPSWHLIFSIRADFRAALTASELWPLLRRAYRHEVNPLRGAALRHAITLPAQRVGVAIESALLRDLERDAAGEPGILPLIQETLVHLWDDGTRRLFTVEQYEALSDGAVSGLAAALARRADTALAALRDDADQLAARHVFLRLVSFGEGRSDTRRQQTLSALSLGEDAACIVRVVAHLTDHRLLTTDAADVSAETLVDLSHETLIATWPTLRAWIADHREAELHRRTLEADAARWLAAGRDTDGLLDAGELVTLDRWITPASSKAVGVSPDAHGLVRASRARLLRGRIFRIASVTILIFGTLALLLLVWLLSISNREARRQATIARNQTEALELRRGELVIALDEANYAKDRAQQAVANNYIAQASTLLNDGQGARAAPYLLEARRLIENSVGDDDDEDARDDLLLLRSLFRWATRSLPVSVVTDAGGVSTLSPDGSRLAVAAETHIDVFDTTSGKKMLTVAYVDRVMPHRARPARRTARGTAWSRAGTQIAVMTSLDLQLLDVSSGRMHAIELAMSGVGDVSLRWSNNGSSLVALEERLVVRIDPDTGRMREIARPPSGYRVLDWNEEKHLLLVRGLSRSETMIWNATTRRPVDRMTTVEDAAWSPDGSLLAMNGPDGIKVWSSGRREAFPLNRQSVYRSVYGSGMSWSPDSARLIAIDDHGSATVWEVETGRLVIPPLVLDSDGGTSRWHVGWSADSGTVAIERAGTVGVWRVPDLKARTVERSPMGFLSVAWRADGTQLALESVDGVSVLTAGGVHVPLPNQPSAMFADWAPRGPLLRITGPENIWVWNSDVAALEQTLHDTRDSAWSPDGRMLARLGRDRIVRFVDPTTNQARRPEILLPEIPTAVAWSPDGHSVAFHTMDSKVHVWDLDANRQIASRSAESVQMIWSPDGARLALKGKRVELWHPATGEVATLEDYTPASGVQDLDWDPAGKRLVTSGNPARVWSADTGKSLSMFTEEATLVAWSPDGVRIATGYPGEIRIWDARSGRPVALPIVFRNPIHVSDLQWSHGGTKLASASADGAAIWDMRWDTGTLEEWEELLEHRCPYRLDSDGNLVPRKLDEDDPLDEDYPLDDETDDSLP